MSESIAETYTDDELSALPQTETVFEQRPLEFDSHNWIQEGYMLIDRCGTHPAQAVSIPSGMMLMKTDGRYHLIDEVTRK